MMNKKTTILGIFSISLIMVFFIISFVEINSNTEYKELENDLKESASLYMLKANVFMTKGEKIKITDKMLKDTELLPDMTVGEDECIGSIEVVKKFDEYVYSPYIKCNKYESYIDK